LKVVENAPAKINLGLKIISKREDGYHNIFSIFQTVDLYDELEITSSRKPGLLCAHLKVPTGSENLVIKAEKLIRKRLQNEIAERNSISSGNLSRMHFTLNKRIPIGGGLAGGSSDAAATLRGLKTLYKEIAERNSISLHNVNIPCNVLSKYASLLGSDVPFLIKGGTSVVSGRGDIIAPVEWPFDFTYVLVYPDFEVSTAWAYGNLKKIRDNNKAYQEMTEKLIAGTLEADEFFEKITNDFEETVFKRYPVLSTIKTQLILNGARRALLTGSGSTVLGIFEDKESASHCAKTFTKQNFKIFIVKATTLL